MIEGKKILCVTLARAGSKGVKDKNIKELLGRPLLSWTITEVQKLDCIDRYCVSTDSPVIKAQIEKMGGPIDKYLRPASLASDSASSASALQDCLAFWEKADRCEYDYVVECMNTNPFKTHIDILKCLRIAIENEAPSVIAVKRECEAHPSRLKTMGREGVLSDIWEEVPESRRQDLSPSVYSRAGAIYVMRRDFLMQGLRYKSGLSVGVQLDAAFSVNIDSIADFITAEHFLSES